jgi:hypothetical protein
MSDASSQELERERQAAEEAIEETLCDAIGFLLSRVDGVDPMTLAHVLVEHALTLVELHTCECCTADAVKDLRQVCEQRLLELAEHAGEVH